MLLACAPGPDSAERVASDHSSGQCPTALTGTAFSSGMPSASQAPAGSEACVRDHAVVEGVAWPSLQDAIDVARTGATVTVCDGVFHESLHLTRDVTLRSEHGLGFTFLVGTAAASVISIEGATVTLVGLDLTSGGGDPWKDPKGGTVIVGGGIYAADAPLLSLESVRIHHNEAQRGGGLFTAEVDQVWLQDVELTANVATERGGGAYLAGGEVSASGLWVRLSEARDGAGLALEQVTAELSGLRVEDCVAAGEGGGVLATGADVVFSDTVLTANAADYGAGLRAQGGSVTADDTTWIGDNDGGTSGGALFLDGVALHLSGTSLTGNQADHGGAAYVMGGTALFDGAVIDDNLGYRGGGLYITDQASVTFDGDTQLTGNTAEAWAGGLAIFGDATLDAPHATLAGNLAPYGGAVLAGSSACTFGADTEVRDNTALEGGGGLYANDASLSGQGMLVSGNTAPLGAGVLLEVDAFYVADGDRIVDNRADKGAGLLMYLGAKARLEDVVVSRNIATELGGGALLHASSGGLTCLDCDWGDGAEDNGPEDIVMANASFTAPPTFRCDASGCAAN